VHRPGGKRIGSEEGGQLGYLLAASVIEVLAGGKELDRLRAGLGGQLQQPSVKALVQEEVRRKDSQLGHRIPPRLIGRCCHCRRGGHSAEEGAVEGVFAEGRTTQLRLRRFALIENNFYILKISRKTCAKVSNKEQIFMPDRESLIMELV
jgi:hypothetical protein